MHANRRRRFWIDRFQTALFWKLALRFLIYQMMVWGTVFFGWYTEKRLVRMLGADAAALIVWIIAGMVLILGVGFIFEIIRFAHRLVGPVVAFRKVCRAIREGEAVEPIKLRQGDFLQDLKTDFNEMLTALEQRGAITFDVAACKQSETGQPRIPAEV